MAQNVAKLANGLVQFATPRLRTAARYAVVEFKPPTPGEFPEVTRRFTEVLNSAKSGKWKNLTTKEALVNTMVGVELVFLFFIGEVIGRGTLVGYDVSRVPPKFPLW